LNGTDLTLPGYGEDPVDLGPNHTGTPADVPDVPNVMISDGDIGNDSAQGLIGVDLPGGRSFTTHGAERARERNFTPESIDNIISNNRKNRVKEIDKVTGSVQWRYQDARGNTVITNEAGNKIVTVYSHPISTNNSNYIPKSKPNRR
ncbi:DUF4258 domain-containing protein, partial [Salmonella enterica subsp. enterica serovar Menston]|nr:DUF4258 domain-containing protein [Salmonella enterica subsp. enterica serovar Menston]